MFVLKRDMLNVCPSLAPARLKFFIFAKSYLKIHPEISDLVETCLMESPIQFWLDASVIPSVISASQIYGNQIMCKIFKLTRHYCYLLHSLRQKLLGIV